jgi:hypothetical protein
MEGATTKRGSDQLVEEEIREETMLGTELRKAHFSQAPVAHACNPSYSGGRDQEDRGWKPAQANSS